MKSVAIVEDDHSIRVTLQAILEASGYFVFSAVNGQDGLALLRSIDPPCLLLLDVHMPIMDGRIMLDEKNRDPSIAKIPVAIMSAQASKSLFPDVNEFLAKPFEISKLLLLVEKYCGSITLSG